MTNFELHVHVLFIWYCTTVNHFTILKPGNLFMNQPFYKIQSLQVRKRIIEIRLKVLPEISAGVKELLEDPVYLSQMIK